MTLHCYCNSSLFTLSPKLIYRSGLFVKRLVSDRTAVGLTPCDDPVQVVYAHMRLSRLVVAEAGNSVESPVRCCPHHVQDCGIRSLPIQGPSEGNERLSYITCGLFTYFTLTMSCISFLVAVNTLLSLKVGGKQKRPFVQGRLSRTSIFLVLE